MTYKALIGGIAIAIASAGLHAQGADQAFVTKLAPTLPKDNLLVMNLCGRGDKDIFAVAEHLGVRL